MVDEPTQVIVNCIKESQSGDVWNFIIFKLWRMTWLKGEMSQGRNHDGIGECWFSGDCCSLRLSCPVGFVLPGALRIVTTVSWFIPRSAVSSSLIHPFLFSRVHARADAALVAVREQWTDTPSSWSRGDPCDQPWDGVTCNSEGRVTGLLVSENAFHPLPRQIGYIRLSCTCWSLSFSGISSGLPGNSSRNCGNLRNWRRCEFWASWNRFSLDKCLVTVRRSIQYSSEASLINSRDLSSNQGLTGSIPPQIQRLQKLTFLYESTDHS